MMKPQPSPYEKMANKYERQLVGIAVWKDTLFVADNENRRIAKVSLLDGTLCCGSHIADDRAWPHQRMRIWHMTVHEWSTACDDDAAAELFVVERAARHVAVFGARDGKWRRNIGGRRDYVPDCVGYLLWPSGLAVSDAGELFVADTTSIVVFDARSGRFLRKLFTRIRGGRCRGHHFISAQAIAVVGSSSGNLAVGCESCGVHVLRGSDGRLLHTFDTTKLDATVCDQSSLQWDSATGTIYVGDGIRHAVYAVDYANDIDDDDEKEPRRVRVTPRQRLTCDEGDWRDAADRVAAYGLLMDPKDMVAYGHELLVSNAAMHTVVAFPRLEWRPDFAVHRQFSPWFQRLVGVVLCLYTLTEHRVGNARRALLQQLPLELVCVLLQLIASEPHRVVVSM